MRFFVLALLAAGASALRTESSPKARGMRVDTVAGFGAGWSRGQTVKYHMVKEPVYEEYHDMDVANQNNNISGFGVMTPVYIKSDRPELWHERPSWSPDFMLKARRNTTIKGFDWWGEDVAMNKRLQASLVHEVEHQSWVCNRWKEEKMKGNFLDVGANIGTYTIPLAECAREKDCKVIATEGNPELAEHLRASIVQSFSWNAILFPYMLGDNSQANRVTVSQLHYNKFPMMIANNTLDAPMTEDEFSLLFQKRRHRIEIPPEGIPFTTADNMLFQFPELQRLMWLKVDLDGNEGHFFEGAGKLMYDFPPCYVIVEIYPEKLQEANSSLDRILKKFHDHYYVGIPTADEVRAMKGRKIVTVSYGRSQEQHFECIHRVAEKPINLDEQKPHEYTDMK